MSASLIRALAELTIAASVAIVVVAALRRPLRCIGGARVAYLGWLLVPASQLVVSLPAPLQPLEVASQTIPQWGARALAAAMPAQSVIAGASGAVTDYGALAVVIWAAVSLALLSLSVRRQRAFVGSLGTVTASTDGTWRSATLRDPLLLGAWRPRIVLPADFESRYDADERALVLAHERAHRARGDTVVNGIATLWLCVFWFNPLMYWAVARLRFDQELACDEVVLAARPAQRRRYADALLRTQLAPDAGLPAPLACPWRSRHPLKERIAMLIRPLPTTLRRRFAAVLTCAALGSGSYALWTMLPGAAYAQAGGPQTTAIITAYNISVVADKGAILTVTAPDFKTRLGDGNNDYEVTLIQRNQDGTNLTFRASSDEVSRVTAERITRFGNGDVELSGNVIVKLLPSGPSSPIALEHVRIELESGVVKDMQFASAVLTTDHAIVERDGTIRMESAVLTLAGQP
jgi:beta-lactamase regulating signal transducer with metallopeptidase domain